mmetsp:Transcript_109352/g.316062  ORF Transcript_109352/g.316062 Transcript_109352/m.316062 type:complete len:250 (+) Transcript_109352:1520-2269(+)
MQAPQFHLQFPRAPDDVAAKHGPLGEEAREVGAEPFIRPVLLRHARDQHCSRPGRRHLQQPSASALQELALLPREDARGDGDHVPHRRGVRPKDDAIGIGGRQAQPRQPLAAGIARQPVQRAQADSDDGEGADEADGELVEGEVHPSVEAGNFDDLLRADGLRAPALRPVVRIQRGVAGAQEHKDGHAKHTRRRREDDGHRHRQRVAAAVQADMHRLRRLRLATPSDVDRLADDLVGRGVDEVERLRDI